MSSSVPIKAVDNLLFLKTNPALDINSMLRGTLQKFMKRTDIAPRLRTTICRSRKVLSHVGYEPTTLSAVRHSYSQLMCDMC